MKPKNPALKLFSFALAFSLFFSTAKTAHAAFICSLGSIGQAYCTFKNVQESLKDINIRRTISDAATAIAIDVPSQFAFGRNFDQLQYCLVKVGGYENQITIPLDLEEPEDDCSDLRATSTLTGVNGRPTQYRSSGSLMGISLALEDIVRNEPIPVNLAFYAKHTASKIPVLNQTAYAANGDVPVLQLVLTVWEKLRNLAYGALAIFMLGIGVMVMLRQKINPQTVITVQAAIPRIIIAVVLITFSYPIVALALQLITPLSGMAIGLLGSFAGLDGSGANFPLTTLVAMGIALPLVFFATGGLALILAMLLIVVTIFLYIKLLFVLIMTIVKIIYAALVAPLTFAWGAVPGNELATVNWFKSLLVNIISIPAILFAIGLAFFMAFSMVDASITSTSSAVGFGPIGDVVGGFGGAAFLLFVAPLIIAIIFLQAGKIPQKLEEAILGRDTKPKKK